MTKIERESGLLVLHLEDSLPDRELVGATLKKEGLPCEIVYVKGREAFEAALASKKFDLIISDFSLPGYDGIEALRTAQTTQPEVPFIFVSGTIGEERAVESLKSGATDYVIKDRLDRLGAVVCRALREASERNLRKQLEEQLRQSQKMEAIGQLAGGVAHDFNNLLTVIRGNTELFLMSEESLSEEGRDWLKQVVAASDRAASLTRQLLTFGRKQVMCPQALSLNEVVGNLIKMLGRLIGADVRLDFKSDSELPFVHADPGMMEQVLMNLVVNARDAMPNGGELFIRTEQVFFDETQGRRHPQARPGSFVRVSVRDTGCGMTPEVATRIFEPFFTTKEAGKGTGLGLATVYGIMVQHQGWIEVTSEPARGSNFQTYLPAIASPLHSSPVESETQKMPGGTETILIAEDDEPVRLLAQRILRNLGYRICEAVSGKAALELWPSIAAKTDLLVTDLVMPDGITGRELADQLRAQKPELKVIFTSGYSHDITTKDTSFFARHRAAFLQKPYSPRVLAQAVRDALDGQ